MRPPVPTRVLVLTDTVGVSLELRRAVWSTCEQATWYDVELHLVVLNPARAEIHLLHPRRHPEVQRAEQDLPEALRQLREAPSGPRVTGSVSLRHDPMDAIEETIAVEPVHEIWLHLEEHARGRHLHQDLPHRLAHLDLPVRVVPHEVRGRRPGPA